MPSLLPSGRGRRGLEPPGRSGLRFSSRRRICFPVHGVTCSTPATMLGQSKTVYQAEIDSAAELIDFWRFNVDFMLRLYDEQRQRCGTTE